MKRRTSISVCALLGVMVVTLAQGATLRYYGDGDYNNVLSVTGTVGWTPDGSGPGGLPGTADQIRVNYGTGSVGNTCTLTNAANVLNFQIGVDQSGTFVVESGGILSTVGASSANAVGYNGYAGGVYGRMTVKTNGVVNSLYYLRVGYQGYGVLTLDGGTFNLSHHLWVGASSTGNGTIILTNGGTLNMTGATNGGNGMIGLGSNNGTSASGGWGYVYVRGGGILNLYNIDGNGGSIQPGSVLDISGSGVVTFPGDKTSVLTNKYIIPGKITAYAGTGTVAIDYNVSNAGKTTLKAVGGYVAPTDCTWSATSGPGFWNDSTNWSCGYVPVSVTVVTFNVPSAIPCIARAAASADSIDMGTNGPGGTLIVTNTGILSCLGTNVNYIGNNSSARMVVENGAVVSFAAPLRVGFDVGANGTLLMNGGTVSVGGMFDLGYQGGTGTAQIKGGTLNLASFDDYASIGAAALLDITGTGTVVLNGDHSFPISYYVSTGQITNSSGAGLLVDYNIIHSGKTTVYPANLPLAPEQVIWNPALLNPSTDPAGWWNVSSNWNMPMCPGNATVVYFNVAGAIPCIVTNAAVAGYVDMGTLAGPGGTLIVTNGGSLTTFANNWTAVGYDNTALLMVEAGSSATLAGHLWVGFNAVADGTVIVDGGTLSVGQMFGLGWNGGKGTCIVTNGGRLNLAQLHLTDSIKGNSVLNVADTGTAVITGNYVSAISNYVAAGKITANGGAGTVVYSFDSGTTNTIVQVAPPRQSVTSATVAGGNATLAYRTTVGHFYHIESTPSLSPAVWTPVAGSSTNAAGASVTFSFPAGSGPVFYRTVSP